MPTYSYKCVKCGKEFTDIKLISEMDSSKCPECNSKAEKIFVRGTFGITGCPNTKV